MSNLSVGQVILDAQRVASRVKDLDTLGSALLVEAEGNNRLVESLRQFQDDLESLNRISNNKSNAEFINRIQQQNAQSSEILKENRELKICLEDYEYAMELIMQKYREHMNNKVLDSKLNFREVYNEKLWHIIRQQRDKINEMAAVMQRAVAMDDETINNELEAMSSLRLENKTLRELLQISKQAGSAMTPIRLKDHLLIDQSVQTESIDDELSLSVNSIENANNNTVIHNDITSVNTTAQMDHNLTTTITNSTTTTTTNTTNDHVNVVVVDATAAVAETDSDNITNHENNNLPINSHLTENSNDISSTTTTPTTNVHVNNDQTLIQNAT